MRRVRLMAMGVAMGVSLGAAAQEAEEVQTRTGPGLVVAEPQVEPDDGPPPWSGQVAASVVSITGNARSTTGNLSGQLTGEWRAWAAQLSATGTYGEARVTDTGDTEITALNGELRLRGDRKLTERLSLYALGGVATDHVASIELRGYGEAGTGYLWLERKAEDFVRTRLRTDLGFRIAQENLFQYYPTPVDLADRTLYQLRLAADFRYALSASAAFNQQVELLEDLSNTDDFRVNATSLVSAQLTESLALQLAFTVRHIGDPAPGRRSTDTELAAGVSLAF